METALGGTRLQSADAVAQWELHLQEEEDEARRQQRWKTVPPLGQQVHLLLAQQIRTGEGEYWHNTIKKILGGQV